MSHIAKTKQQRKNLCCGLRAWDQFWFQPKDLFSLAVARFFIFGLMFVLYFERQLNIETYYYDGGFVPLEHVKTLAQGYFSERLWFYPQTDELVFAVHSIFLVLLLCISLGIGGRVVTGIAFVLHLAILQRNLAINFGVDLYNTHWLLYFTLVKSNEHFSLPSFFRKKNKNPSLLTTDILSLVGFRLLQLQLIISYVYAGIEKLKGGTWWSGIALWQVLANDQLTPYDFSFFKQVPFVVAAVTYLTLIYEIYSPVGFFHPRLKPFFIIGGLLFHFAIAFMIGIYFFGFILAASLIFFIPSDFLRSCLQMKKINRKVKKP